MSVTGLQVLCLCCGRFVSYCMLCGAPGLCNVAGAHVPCAALIGQRCIRLAVPLNMSCSMTPYMFSSTSPLALDMQRQAELLSQTFEGAHALSSHV